MAPIKTPAAKKRRVDAISPSQDNMSLRVNKKQCTPAEAAKATPEEPDTFRDQASSVVDMTPGSPIWIARYKALKGDFKRPAQLEAMYAEMERAKAAEENVANGLRQAPRSRDTQKQIQPEHQSDTPPDAQKQVPSKGMANTPSPPAIAESTTEDVAAPSPAYLQRTKCINSLVTRISLARRMVMELLEHHDEENGVEFMRGKRADLSEVRPNPTGLSHETRLRMIQRTLRNFLQHVDTVRREREGDLDEQMTRHWVVLAGLNVDEKVERVKADVEMLEEWLVEVRGDD